jgi:hypothetical protein
VVVVDELEVVVAGTVVVVDFGRDEALVVVVTRAVVVEVDDDAVAGEVLVELPRAGAVAVSATGTAAARTSCPDVEQPARTAAPEQNAKIGAQQRATTDKRLIRSRFDRGATSSS